MGYEDYLAARKKFENPFTEEELDRLEQVESGGNPHAVNKETGAMGAYQFMPHRVAEFHQKGIKFNPFDRDQAREMAKQDLLNAYKLTGSKEKALASYGGFVTKDPSDYISKILTPAEEKKEKGLIERKLEALKAGEVPEEEKGLTIPRTAELLGRGMTPAVTGAAAGGALAGPGGALIGSMALPIGDVLNTAINKVAGTNLQMPSEVVSKGMANLGYAEPTGMGERAIESAGGALASTGAQLPAFARMATEAGSPMMRSFASQMAQAPKAQLAASAPSAVAGQVATELTGNPLIGTLASAATGAPFGFNFGRQATNAPNQQALIQESKNLFTKAKDSGIVLEPKQFAGAMKGIENELRTEGYRPPIAGATDPYAKITNALTNLTDPNVPKDFVELQGLRKVIQNAQSSTDPSERRLAGILKDHFDDYVLNAPESAIKAGSKQGLDLWKDARQSYSKLKKAEIFDDMFENAQLDQSKFTASGAENSLATQLRNLAKNDKKMRMFTADEQDAIKEAAKGGKFQNLLKFYGRFAPTGPVTSIFTGGAAYAEPTLGVPFALGAMGARKGAETLRKQSVSNLADMMRLGERPEVEARTKNIPVTTLRGLLSGAQ
jgi:hypothetical protein